MESMKENSLYEMSAGDAIMSRSSAARLDAPAPGDEEIQQLLAAADRAPDHGRLRPWRITVVKQQARATFGDMLADSLLRKKATASAQELDRERAKAMRAPLIFIVGAKVDESSKIPAIEQLLAVGAAVENMFLLAHALGYGAMWKTGDAAYDDALKARVGLGPRDHIVAFLYVGTPVDMMPVREPSSSGVVSWL
jgi:nitroreductase